MKQTFVKLKAPVGAFTVAVLATLGQAQPARAGESLFGWTYLAEVLPSGGVESELWSTYRTKKSQGTYNLWQNRAEIEYGITDRWQVSLYLNQYSVKAEANNSNASRNNFTVIGDGDEVSGGGPVTFGSHVPFYGLLPIPSAPHSKSAFESVSLETIYQFTSPYKDGVGLAGYLEYSKGSNTEEFEIKAIVQKNLLEDQLVLAANIALEFENEKWSGIGTERETLLQLTAGASYRLAPAWHAGLELRNDRGYNNHSLSSGDRQYSAWFLGPNISYTAPAWFVTLTYMGQMPWATAYSDSAKVEQVSGRNYKAAERDNWRLKVGYSF